MRPRLLAPRLEATRGADSGRTLRRRIRRARPKHHECHSRLPPPLSAPTALVHSSSSLLSTRHEERRGQLPFRTIRVRSWSPPRRSPVHASQYHHTGVLAVSTEAPHVGSSPSFSSDACSQNNDAILTLDVHDGDAGMSATAASSTTLHAHAVPLPASALLVQMAVPSRKRETFFFLFFPESQACQPRP